MNLKQSMFTSLCYQALGMLPNESCLESHFCKCSGSCFILNEYIWMNECILEGIYISLILWPFSLWYKIELRIHFFPRRCIVFQHFLLKRLSFTPTWDSETFVEGQLITQVWFHFLNHPLCSIFLSLCHHQIVFLLHYQYSQSMWSRAFPGSGFCPTRAPKTHEITSTWAKAIYFAVVCTE